MFFYTDGVIMGCTHGAHVRMCCVCLHTTTGVFVSEGQLVGKCDKMNSFGLQIIGTKRTHKGCLEKVSLNLGKSVSFYLAVEKN